MTASILLQRLDARDRALFARCASEGREGRKRSRAARLVWTALTHLGGVVCSIAAATLPLGVAGPTRFAARQACVVLVVSHLIVQLTKRTIGRPRPSRRLAVTALVKEPDAFSFPSGHAAAAMAVAVVYAHAMPALAPVLIPGAVLVGASRVFLGVHYPGDVLIGQAISVLTALPFILR